MILRKIYKIRGKVIYSHNYTLVKGKSPSSQLKILQSMEEFSKPVTVSIDDKLVTVFFYSEFKVYGEIDVPKTNEAVSYFTSHDIPLNNGFELYLSVLDRAVRKVLSVLKYLFNYEGIDEHLYHSHKTMIRLEDKWIDCPDRNSYKWHYSNPFYCIDSQVMPTIQKLLDSDVESFYSLKFLHKAKNEENLRDKWIYTATCLELTLKEFLYKHDPRYKAEMNTSPINISSLLDKVAIIVGKDFFNKEFLQKSTEIRNDIIHRPYDRLGLKYDNCIRYMDEVETLAFKLLDILAPNNFIIKERIASVNNNKEAG